ncbi:MAG TPA: DUF3107 domain-containing protein [Candidatus Avipropionibacterium avicola]|uniref:DUF3107 domain-containing protein n=1 Tax=Candidatus Avipropionibacterium avicola TaxID=2840701 RepID=A0A9D1GX33_9ACTN|nr:DUF3107 domain-containing protein [Candidatus Avipropionibacterium avicola]
MEIKVGVRQISREVVVETSDSAEQVEKSLQDAIESNGVFRLSGERGRTVLIPAAGIGYVEIGDENARPVGFGAV